MADRKLIGKNYTLANAKTVGFKNINNGGTINGDLDITGDITIQGDIFQNGSAYETHIEHLFTEKDLITLRDGALSGLGVGEYAGFIFEKYDGTNDGYLVVGSDGTARVGDVGGTQAILTRDEVANLAADDILVWDNTTNKAVGKTPAELSLVTLTGYNKTNWDTAHGWGDHSLEGYIKDYTVTENDVTQHEAALSITESQISDLTHITNNNQITNGAGYITGYTETDPVFSASTAAGITSGQVTQWDTAYGWGDHAGKYLELATSNINNTGPTKTSMGLFPSTASTMIGNEYNIALNGKIENRLTYTVSGSSGFTVSQAQGLTDGKLGPQYSADGVDPADPLVITISGFPSTHTQTGGVIGWTARYWYPNNYKVEVWDDYLSTPGWKTIHDQTATDASTKNLAIPIYPSHAGKLTQIRITVYKTTGSTGSNGHPRFGLSEVYFSHPEAIAVGQYWNPSFLGGLPASDYLTSFTESDPIFTASVAAGIDSTDISNWNTAYGWGNHASAGYLTDHQSLAGLVPLQIAGSLDVNAENGNGMFVGSSGSWTNRGTTGNNASALISMNTHSGNYYSQLWFDSAGDNFYHRGWSATTPGAWNKVLTSANIGDYNYITDYTVTEGDVTAHQAALSITESQISDLAHVTNNNQLTNGAGYITSYTDTNTWRTVTAGGNTLGTSETLKFVAGSNVTISESAGSVTINSSYVNTQRAIDDTPVNGATTTSISSNWAYDHDVLASTTARGHLEVADGTEILAASTLYRAVNPSGMADYIELHTEWQYLGGGNPTEGANLTISAAAGSASTYYSKVLVLAKDTANNYGSVEIPADRLSTTTSYDWTVLMSPTVGLDFDWADLTGTSWILDVVGDWATGDAITDIRVYGQLKRGVY